jgi:hypothetical protein
MVMAAVVARKSIGHREKVALFIAAMSGTLVVGGAGGYLIRTASSAVTTVSAPAPAQHAAAQPAANPGAGEHGTVR